MTAKRKEQIRALLKGIETGDETAVAVVNPNQYIQHNPQTQEGGEGLAALFKRLAKSSPRVNLVRVFADGDYVFAHKTSPRLEILFYQPLQPFRPNALTVRNERQNEAFRLKLIFSLL